MKYICFLHTFRLRISRPIPDIVIFYWMLLFLLFIQGLTGTQSMVSNLKVILNLEVWNSECAGSTEYLPQKIYHSYTRCSRSRISCPKNASSRPLRQFFLIANQLNALSASISVKTHARC